MGVGSESAHAQVCLLWQGACKRFSTRKSFLKSQDQYSNIKQVHAVAVNSDGETLYGRLLACCSPRKVKVHACKACVFVMRAFREGGAALCSQL